MKELTVFDMTLFLGCRVKTTRGIGDLVDISIRTNEAQYGVLLKGFVGDEGRVEYVNDVQPILRKLTDATEAERIKVYNLNFPDRSKISPRDKVNWSQNGLSRTLTPKALIYMAQRELDIFGWIKKGHAIEKKESQEFFSE